MGDLGLLIQLSNCYGGVYEKSLSVFVAGYGMVHFVNDAG
jgi:hypothetical protein